MKLKISLELWLPGGREPLRAASDTVDSRTLGRLAAELTKSSGGHPADADSSSPLPHLKNLDPQAVVEFLESL